MSWRECGCCDAGRGGEKGEEGTNRSICPSFISCALISDLKSGSGALAAAAGVFGITTPGCVLPGDGCAIMCVKEPIASPALDSSCIAKLRNSSRLSDSEGFSIVYPLVLG